MCHVIADDVALDGADLPLADAVAAAEACSFASVLCGLPGQVAFFFDEMAAPRVRLLLRQPGSAREPANALDGPASRRKFVFGIVSLGASRWPPQIVIRYPAMQRPGTCILGIVMAAVATLLRLNVAHIFRACWAGAPSIGADYQTMMAWIDIFNIAIITGLSVAAAGWLVPRRPPGAG